MCAYLSALAAAPGAHAAEYSLTPAARAGSTYTDNPRFAEANPTSSAGVVGEMSMNLQRRTELLDLSLLPRVRSARYRDDETLNSDDQFVDASLKYRRERSEWAATAGFVHDTTLTSELGSTGIVDTNRRHESITLSASPTLYLTERLTGGLQAYWQDNHYIDAESTGLVDYDYRTLSVFAGFAAAERSDFILTAQGGRLRVPVYGARTDDATLRLAWKYRLDSLWSTELSAGPAYVDTETRRDNGVVFAANANRAGERWNVTFNAGRDLAPTGRGVLTKRDRVTLRTSRRLTEFLTGASSLQWVRNEDLALDPSESTYLVNYGRFELSAYWRFAEHWSLSLAASAAAQESGRDANRTHNYQASLSLVWNGQPLVP